MTIMERLERHAMDSTRPNVEWEWGQLAIHAGSIRSQREAAELTDILAYFAQKLPEVAADGPFDPKLAVKGKLSP